MSAASASASGSGTPCGACKFLRRKCVSECIFAPYFDVEEGAAQFAAVHKIFGASNVSKLLHMIPSSRRNEAVVSICYEAQARLKDPVYGCVAHIFALQQQVVNLQAELAFVRAQLARRLAASSNDSSMSSGSTAYNAVSVYDVPHSYAHQQQPRNSSSAGAKDEAVMSSFSAYNINMNEHNHMLLVDVMGGLNSGTAEEGLQQHLLQRSSSSRLRSSAHFTPHPHPHQSDLQALAHDLLSKNTSGTTPLSDSSSSP